MGMRGEDSRHQHDGIHGDFLRVPSVIGRDPGVGDRKIWTVRISISCLGAWLLAALTWSKDGCHVNSGKLAAPETAAVGQEGY